MRSFRDSIARHPRSLCTLRADVSADYATLASGWRLPLAGSSSQMTGLIQSISLPFDTSFDYGLFTAREDATLLRLKAALRQAVITTPATEYSPLPLFGSGT